MEFFPLIIGIVVVVGLCFLIRLIIPSKGEVGERVVAGKLDFLPKDQYRVLNDVTLPTPQGSSQIDHLVVSVYGIFVIETSPRLGGDYITSTLTPLSTGVNLEDELLKISLGEEINPSAKAVQYSGVRFFSFDEGSVIMALIMAVPYSILGGGFAYIYAKTNNITNNILCHGFHNFVVSLLHLILF